MPRPKEALRRVRRQAVVGLVGGTIALAASLVSAVQGLETRQLAFLSAITGAIVLGFSAYMMSTRFARKFVREVETVSNLPPHDLAHLSAVRARTASIIFVIAFVVLVPVAVVLGSRGLARASDLRPGSPEIAPQALNVRAEPRRHCSHLPVRARRRMREFRDFCATVCVTNIFWSRPHVDLVAIRFA